MKNKQAFPRPASVGMDYLTGESAVIDPQEGMTLRDYFAAGVLSTIYQQHIERHFDNVTKLDEEECARNCYIMADAMLKAREA